MADKHTFSIFECPDGYEIADDVFSGYGSLVVSKNTIVNDYIRQKLKNFKVDKVVVFEPTSQKTSDDNPKAAFIATKRNTWFDVIKKHSLYGFELIKDF